MPRSANARYFGTHEETERVRLLLRCLAPVAGPCCCLVCTQPLPESRRRPRKFCTTGCRDRARVLRRRELLPGAPTPLLPAPRKPSVELPEDVETVRLTTRLRR